MGNVVEIIKNNKDEDMVEIDYNELPQNTIVSLVEYVTRCKPRRSNRKSQHEINREKQMIVENAILNKIEDNLEVQIFPVKGRGIIATKEFQAGDFVVEYIGDIIDKTEALRRELEYSQDDSIGSYMYFFDHGNRTYCVDATKETPHLGRLINHSRKGNLTPKPYTTNSGLHLIFLANQFIKAGVELMFDYNDRRKESIRQNPWLKL